MEINLNENYKTLNNEIVKVVGASVLNYADTMIIEENEPTVILVHCEKANYYLILYAITALIPRFDDITHALNLTWYQIHQYRVKDEEQK